MGVAPAAHASGSHGVSLGFDGDGAAIADVARVGDVVDVVDVVDVEAEAGTTIEAAASAAEAQAMAVSWRILQRRPARRYTEPTLSSHARPGALAHDRKT